MLRTEHISQHAGFGSLVEPIKPSPMDSGSSGRLGKRRSNQRNKMRVNLEQNGGELVESQQERRETESDMLRKTRDEQQVFSSSGGQIGDRGDKLGDGDFARADLDGHQSEQNQMRLVEEEAGSLEPAGQAQQFRRRALLDREVDGHVEPGEGEEFSGEKARGRQSSGGEHLVEPSSELGQDSSATQEFKAELVWTNIFLFIILHSCLPIGVYMLYTQRPWKTLLFSIFGMYASGLGVTGGSHRLWSHRAYKAKWPVQVILVILQTMAGQNSIYTWSRDHRVHHKFAETNADPHNIKRGFFFAHMGWLCCKKHPEVKIKGKLIDMSDLEANPFVMFQHRHFWWMSALFTVLVPTMIPVLLWNERFWTSFVFSFMVRYLITLHGTWLVNSAAHYYGERPYDERIEARESPYVIYNGLGEGFHNYHHTFPYDYATSEFGKYLNITTTFIDLCASLGLVEGRRKVDKATILKRRLRTGDLTEESLGRNKSIEESDETSPTSTSDSSGPLAPFNNIIHEMPYISGLTSMQYTM